MPVEYVQSGPEFERDGAKVQPMAPIYTCEECGYRGASFIVKQGETVLAYCGWRNGE